MRDERQRVHASFEPWLQTEKAEWREPITATRTEPAPLISRFTSAMPGARWTEQSTERTRPNEDDLPPESAQRADLDRTVSVNPWVSKFSPQRSLFKGGIKKTSGTFRKCARIIIKKQKPLSIDMKNVFEIIRVFFLKGT